MSVPNVVNILASQFSRCKVIISERNDPKFSRLFTKYGLFFSKIYKYAPILIVQRQVFQEWYKKHFELKCSVIPNPMPILEFGKIYSHRQKLISLMLALTFIVSCSSTTVINTTDKEAKIYVNDEYKGKGSVTHSDTKIVGSSSVVQIKKKGCESKTYIMSRSEEFDVGACLGGVLVLVPFLWIMKYKPTRTYEFECEAAN